MADAVVSVLKIPQGSRFEVIWPLVDLDTGTPPDMTDWAARCEVRDSYGGNLITRFHSNGTWDGHIEFEAGTGNIILSLPSVKTAALTPISNAVFDVELIDPTGEPTRIIQGRAHVTPEVTTDA